MKNSLYLLLFVLVSVLVWKWEGRAIVHPPGLLVPDMPRQSDPADPRPFTVDGYRLTPRADFRIRARVLSRENYYLGDEARLSPVDLALGWGSMSDQAVLDRIDVSQAGRWYFTRYDLPGPLTDRQIIRSSGNMHMIPANEWVRDRLGDVRSGDLIRARGFLVDVERDDGFRWRTSRTRDDTGSGSCEIFYLEQLYIEPRP